MLGGLGRETIGFSDIRCGRHPFNCLRRPVLLMVYVKDALREIDEVIEASERGTSMVATGRTQTERTVDAYMRLPYRMEIYWDEDSGRPSSQSFPGW